VAVIIHKKHSGAKPDPIL
jgi:hypothetical protein